MKPFWQKRKARRAMKKIIAISLISLVSFAVPALANSGGEEFPLPEQQWSFDGMLGTFDRASLQRGFQVYREVCSACHGMRLLSYRNLEDIGLNELQVKAIAADYTVIDGPNDEGDMFERTALPSDRFVSPYDNEKQARATNNGALPPDLSLITKAREDGPNYVYGILTGYADAPHDVHINKGMHYNMYFAGNQIAMPAPLSDGQVSYVDGTEASVGQMAHDVVQFLTWAAEPHMEARKRMGVKVLIFLLIFAGVMYATKKKIWKDVK